MVSLYYNIPNCLAQAALPALMSVGIITSLELTNPVSVWVPPLDSSHFRNEIAKTKIDAVNAVINEHLKRTVELFLELSKATSQPVLLNPILPMGTYVSIKYSMYAPDVLKLLLGLESVKVIGMNHFLFAITDVLVRLDLLAKRE